MNLQSLLPLLYLVIGVVLLSVVVSTLTILLYGPTTTERTIVVERPRGNNYRGWWGYPGAGLPGWGRPNVPPPPSPHPKPPNPSPGGPTQSPTPQA